MKTTIAPDDKLWMAFQGKVLEKEGKGRKLNKVIEELIRGYVDGRFKV